jgi:co-chaperonin GroES (HSP10)
MKNQKIVPVGKRVLILEKQPEKYYPGTQIAILDASKSKTYQGHVIAIGKDVSEINVGDLVQYVDYATPIQMKHNGEDHLLIAQGDILAVIENE